MNISVVFGHFHQDLLYICVYVYELTGGAGVQFLAFMIIDCQIECIACQNSTRCVTSNFSSVMVKSKTQNIETEWA